ncbi:MAG: site-specific integrase [Solirubrobacterales bacterium]
MPLRAILRRALSLGQVAVNPCSGIEAPAVRGRRERFASPTEAAALIAAVPERDRAIWATAMYGGLRRGELRAPRVEDIDPFLVASLTASGRAGSDRIFGSTASRPFAGERLSERADKAWGAAGLDRITLHECRHTFASSMIAAGVNAKALSTFMGHANISITLDRYGHLMPGSGAEAAGMPDSYRVKRRAS